MEKVIIFGATGNTGQCLVAAGLARGYEVTAFVRDSAKLRRIFPPEALQRVRVYEGDALNERAVGAAMFGHRAAVNAAQDPADAEIFTKICANVVMQAERYLSGSRRLWLFGGLPGLDVPHTRRMGATLPGMRPILRAHKVNYELLKKSTLDWSFMCPGPMMFDPARRVGDGLLTTTEVMPYRVGRWTKWLPGLAHSFIMLRRLPELTVSYEDVADLVMSNLASGGPYSRKRVGVAAPIK